MEAARSTGSFNRRITVADSNNIIAVLNMDAINSKYQTFGQDYLVEFQVVLEDLKVTVGLMGLAEAPWPEVNALMSESEKMAEIARIRTQGQKISLGLYTAIGNGPWQYESEVVLQNQGGSESHVPILVPFLSSNETLLIAGNSKLGVRVEPKWNQPLKASDYLIIKGTWRQVVSFSEITKTTNNTTNMESSSNRIAGEIIAFGGSNTPNGWLQCNGSEVAIAAYPRLSQALGTSWGALTNGAGGAGVTHFRLPDLRGRALIGVGQGSSLSARAIGEVIGAESHTLLATEMPSHTHTQNPHNHVQDAHNHVQTAHNHTQDAHNHVQTAHNHTQGAHNHVQDAHNHTQNAHAHAYNWFTGANAASSLTASGGVLTPTANAAATTSVTATNQAATATNQTATAVNQAATATNQAATATNQVATATNQAATATNQAATGVNQATGGVGGVTNAHNNMQPSAVVNYLVYAG